MAHLCDKHVSCAHVLCALSLEKAWTGSLLPCRELGFPSGSYIEQIAANGQCSRACSRCTWFSPLSSLEATGAGMAKTRR